MKLLLNKLAFCASRLCPLHSHWLHLRQALTYKCRRRCLILLYLREGADVLSVEVVQLLQHPALRHMSQRMTTAGCTGQEELLGPLQLDVTHTLFDLPENPSWCFEKMEKQGANEKRG